MEPNYRILNNPSPAEFAAAVTPSDTVNFGQPTRALYIGGAGTVAAIIDGSAVSFVGLNAGTILPIRCSRVNTTGTTATSIVALY